MAQGTDQLNFGNAPGGAEVSTLVTGLSGLTSGSYIEAWQMMESSSNRTAEENRIDPIDCMCEYVSASSFRLYGAARLGTIIGIVPVRWATV